MLAVGDEELLESISRALRGKALTRQRLLLHDLLQRSFERLAVIAAEQQLTVGYSVKTNPRSTVLRAALQHGFLAETISPGEVEQALHCGFAANNCIYNGRVPAARLRIEPGIVFADSVETFRQNAEHFGSATLLGARLRPQGIESHFGMPREEHDDLIAAVREARRDRIGISYQSRSEDYHGRDWESVARDVIERAREVQDATGTRIVVFDTGGGRSPAEFDQLVASGCYQRLRDVTRKRLPYVEQILIEPGQEVVFSIEAMVAPILEVRRRGDRRDVVVDAGLPDFPEIAKVPHRLFLARDGAVELIARSGTDRILGRTCLEEDVVASDAELPADIAVGDAVVVGDVGAYDASMEFAFAQGLRSGNTAP